MAVCDWKRFQGLRNRSFFASYKRHETQLAGRRAIPKRRNTIENFGGICMKKVIVLATLLGGMVFAVPAFAQGELVPFERPTFTGFTATALVGVDVVRADDGTDSESENGAAYGGAVGYDLGLGHFVFGVEAELADSSTETTETSVITAGDSFTLK